MENIITQLQEIGTFYVPGSRQRSTGTSSLPRRRVSRSVLMPKASQYRFHNRTYICTKASDKGSEKVPAQRGHAGGRKQSHH